MDERREAGAAGEWNDAIKGMETDELDLFELDLFELVFLELTLEAEDREDAEDREEREDEDRTTGLADLRVLFPNQASSVSVLVLFLMIICANFEDVSISNASVSAIVLSNFLSILSRCLLLGLS